MTTLSVDGLTWDVPDHDQAHAVDEATVHAAAARYDADASRWELRVQTALEIVRAGLEALRRALDTDHQRIDSATDER